MQAKSDPRDPRGVHPAAARAAPERGPGRYLAETYADRLPMASTGKSCIRFKRLADLDQDTLATLLREAAQWTPPS